MSISLLHTNMNVLRRYEQKYRHETSVLFFLFCLEKHHYFATWMIQWYIMISYCTSIKLGFFWCEKKWLLCHGWFIYMGIYFLLDWRKLCLSKTCSSLGTKAQIFPDNHLARNKLFCNSREHGKMLHLNESQQCVLYFLFSLW